MSISIRIAEGKEEKEKVYRLRYKVYIEEMKRTSKYMDTKRKTIEDPFDDDSVIFYAEDEGKVVGTLRMNMNENIPKEYVQLYQMEKLLEAFPKSVSITTKYVVEESYRKTSVASKLASEGFQYGLTHGIMFNIIDTNPYLLRLYQKMGYRMYTSNISHPEYGNVIPMVIFDDYQYLSSIRSPFRAVYKDKEISSDGVEFFRQYYRQYIDETAFFSLADEEIYSIVAEKIKGNPSEILSFLYNLKEEECKKILKYFDYISYKKDTIILQESHAPQLVPYRSKLAGSVQRFPPA